MKDRSNRRAPGVHGDELKWQTTINQSADRDDVKRDESPAAESSQSSPPRFRRGDIVGVRGPARLSRLIRWATRQRWESPTIINHHGVVVNDTDDIESVYIVEALWRVRHHRLVDQYGGKPHQVEIWRIRDLDDWQLETVKRTALSYVGRQYPFHRLLFQLCDERLFGGRMVFRRAAVFGRWRICTPLVVSAYWRARETFGYDSPAQANPDNFRDWLVSCPERATVVLPLQTVPKPTL